jgi:cell division protein FtsX
LPNAVQLARQIREKEQEKKAPRNIVEEIKETANSNRAVAWVVIIFVVLAAVVTFTKRLYGKRRSP